MIDVRKLALSLSLATVAACAAKEATRDSAPAATGEVVQIGDGDLEKLPDQQAQTERGQVVVTDLVRNVNTFAFDLYRSVGTEQFVVSPYGVATMLAIARAGAAGETRRQIVETSRLQFAEDDVHRMFQQLHGAIHSRSIVQTREVRRGFRLRAHSGVWTTQRITPTTRFMGLAHSSHLATLESFDFAANPDDARAAINKYVADATVGTVEGILTTSNPLSRLVVTNTVQWDAPWTLPFERRLTTDADFSTPSGPKRVPMMHGRARVGYLDGDGFKLVELPYADGAVSAWVVLPDEDKLDFDSGLTADFFAWMIQNAKQNDVDIRLPRFQLKSRYSLKSALSTMGMPNVFDPEKSDLSRLSPHDPDVPLFVDNFIHVAQIAVDEDGSNAAATTRGSVSPTTSRTQRFVASRPFLIIVRDAPTGAILAMAKVSNP